MTFLVERLAELRQHVRHLRDLTTRVSRQALEADMTLRNDVLFSLLMVAQLVIDIAGELAARRGDRFEDYREAIRTLGRDDRFPPELVAALESLPGFRNVVVHEYVALNLDRAVEAVRQLDPSSASVLASRSKRAIRSRSAATESGSTLIATARSSLVSRAR